MEEEGVIVEEVNKEIVIPCGKWMRYFGFTILLQFIGVIIVSILMVAEIFFIMQQYEIEEMTQEEIAQIVVNALLKYLIIFMIIAIIVGIIAITTGLKIIPMKEYEGIFLIAGVLIIIGYITQIIGSAYSIYFLATIALEKITYLMEMGAYTQLTGGMIAQVPTYILIIAFILLGIALYQFGEDYEEYSDVKTWGIVTLIGGVLIFIGIGYIILMISLIMAGGKLKRE